MSARSSVILIVVAFAIVITVASACTTTTVVHAVQNLCQIYSAVGVPSSGNSDDDTGLYVSGGTLVLTVTNTATVPASNTHWSTAVGANQFWCNTGFTGFTSAGQTPSATDCSWANGETAVLGSGNPPGTCPAGGTSGSNSHGATSNSVCAQSGPGITNIPFIGIGAILGRIGTSTLPGFSSAGTTYDWNDAGYFQVFCQHKGASNYPLGVTETAGDGCTGVTATDGGSNLYSGTYSSTSLSTPPANFQVTITIPADVSGELYLCYNDWQNNDNSGSIQVQLDYSAPTGVCGDPQFKGLRGQNYQIHGVDGAIYNIISDRTAQVNARFSFLDGPRKCPIMPSTNKTSGACWSHAGSYLSEVAVHLIDGTKIHIESGPATVGFSSVTVDNSTVKVGSAKKLNYISTHELRVSAGPFVIELENVDGFVNLRSVALARGVTLDNLKSHGLLGQTWQEKRYDGRVKEIEGDVDEYVVNSLFDNDFIFNQFY